MIYWDTSCVVKLYAMESDSPQWETFARDCPEGFVSSAIMRTEAAYAFERKEYGGEIRSGGADALLELLDHDITVNRFSLFPVGDDVLREAADIARACYRNKNKVPLRTIDGIHLATARILKCTQLATADSRMRASAKLIGLNVVQ